MSHFGSLGFAVGDISEVEPLVSTARDRAVENGDVVDPAHGRTATYRDPSGAQLTVHEDGDGGIECVQIGFAAEGHVRWRPLGVVRDPVLAPGAVARATLWLVGRPVTLREEPWPVRGLPRSLVPQGEVVERPSALGATLRPGL